MYNPDLMEELFTWLENSKYYLLPELQETLSPDFTKTDKVHDWKNYIPVWFQDNWGELTPITKLGLFIMACEQAEKEG